MGVQFKALDIPGLLGSITPPMNDSPSETWGDSIGSSVKQP